MAEVPHDPFDQPSPQAIEKYYAGMRAFWHPVLRSEDLPEGRPLAVDLLGRPLVLARLDGAIVALEDLCRHFQARISQGEVVVHAGQECLMCPYHGWTYAADGQVVHIPQLSPGREIPTEAKLPVFRTTEKLGLIWVCLDDQPRYALPEFPELADPAFHANALRVYPPWQASAPRILMGALDDTHFPWVHTGILGDRSNPAPPDHRVWREGETLRVSYRIDQPRNPSTGEERGAGGLDRIRYENTVSLPGVIRLVKAGADGTIYVIWLATCPNRYNQTTTFWRLARNYDLDPARDAGYEEFEDRVRAQDKTIVEGQRPWLLPPFWTKLALPLRPADLPLIEYQRILQELGVATEV